jgi:hypothetical protein
MMDADLTYMGIVSINCTTFLQVYFDKKIVDVVCTTTQLLLTKKIYSTTDFRYFLWIVGGVKLHEFLEFRYYLKFDCVKLSEFNAGTKEYDISSLPSLLV